MSAIRRFALRLMSFLRPGRSDREVSREISAHLQILEDSFTAQGMSPDEARQAARRAFGGVEQTKAYQRDARAFRWLDESWLDVKLGIRMLFKYPGLTIVGGIGIAVATAIGVATFAFFYAYLYATLPVQEGERIVAVENWNLATNNEDRRSMYDFLTWRAALKEVDDLAAFRTTSRNLIVQGGKNEPVRVAEVTASAFRVTRVPPLLGRPILEPDHEPGAPSVVVIGDDVWRSRFGADPSVVGRQVRMGNVVRTVVGVMPEGYLFPMNHNYWIPLSIEPGIKPASGPDIFIFGRLARGASSEDAQAEVGALGIRAARDLPDTHTQLRPLVMPYTYPLLDIQDVDAWQMWVMQSSFTLLLVVVAMNVAILIYARTATRRGELALRTALGASRARIVGQLFVEALVLSLVGTAVGLGLARFGLSQAHQILLLEGVPAPYWIDYGLPGEAVIYAIALAVFAAVIAGVLPALRGTGPRLASILRLLGGGSGLTLGRTWTALIVGQVAFAVAAIPITLALSWHDARGGMTTPAFDASHYVVALASLDPEPPPGVEPGAFREGLPDRMAAFHDRLTERLQREAWVLDIAAALESPGDGLRVHVDVDDSTAPRTLPEVRVTRVAGDYFAVFGAPMLTGRGLQSSDRPDGAAVVVNRAFVRQVLNDGAAVGRRFTYRDALGRNPGEVDVLRHYEIVGVVADLENNRFDPNLVAPAVYHPFDVRESVGLSLILRVRGVATDLTDTVRQVTTSVDPTVRLTVIPMSDFARQQQLASRLMGLGVGLSVFSVLLLSSAGIYALVSFTISQRRKEIGIRTSLGADRAHLLWSIFSRVAWQIGGGVVAGVVVALALDAVSGGQLVGPERVILLPAVAGIMILSGVVASFGPARRGLRIEPTQALKEE